MDKSILENIGQYGAYTFVIVVSFIKIFTSSYSFIKDLIKGKEITKDKSNVVVNVNSNPESDEHFDSKNNWGKALILLLDQSRILGAMYSLKSDILKEQMDYYAKFSQRIKIQSVEVMVELLKDAGIDDVHYGTYFSNFENFIEMCENMVRLEFRQMCRENGFAQYNTNDYRILINNNIVLLEGLIMDLLRKRYTQKEYIRNFKKIYRIANDLRIGFKDCFENARNVAVERENSVKKDIDEFDCKIFNMTGEHYCLKI